MRITTKIIQNNSLTNINTNKLMQDKLSQQMSTEKKVSRPSDDPIVAIRALRLRTNVNQVTQYYEKNIPDAESWLEVTEGALSSMSEVVTDMIAQCTKGSNEDLTTEDRETILTALKNLREEVYSTGNSDYAGRFIFTGYRTDTSLTMNKDCVEKYEITEQVQSNKIDSVTYVDTDELLDINESNYSDNAYAGIVEQDITQTEVHRIRLSYEELDGTMPVIKMWKADANHPDGGSFEPMENVDYEIASIYDTDNAYEEINKDGNEDTVILLKETGELLLGKNVYKKLMDVQDNPKTSIKEDEILVTYEKSNWDSKDLRPEHYFACTKVNADPAKSIHYNQDYLKGISDEEKQVISYDVGMNQTIRVNTTADEVFTHDISRDVEDMLRSMEETAAMQKQVEKLKKMLEGKTNETEISTLQKQLAAAEKAYTFLSEKTQKLFESGITKMQGHLDAVNFAVTENGTRGQKLELISNRLMSQKTNFETLRSENEDIDITEVAIKLSSAELTYNAALMATGKVLQNNLMNFI